MTLTAPTPFLYQPIGNPRIPETQAEMERTFRLPFAEYSERMFGSGPRICTAYPQSNQCSAAHSVDEIVESMVVRGL